MTDAARNPWWVFTGSDTDRDPNALNLPRMDKLPEPPPWRRFEHLDRERALTFLPETEHIDKINAALYLRRPLLITGNPGTGKTTLVYAVARELGLGPVLRWSITSRSSLEDGLYEYDAVARLHDSYLESQPRHQPPGAPPAWSAKRSSQRPIDIGRYLTLGPLGTAFFANEHQGADGQTRYFPRVLLIDEIDKSDIDLPNDLLHVFEEGRFSIPELVRLKDREPEVPMRGWGKDADRYTVVNGEVHCRAFPLVVMTSNGERDFPPAFRRRCLQLRMQPPNKDRLRRIVLAHLFGVPADPSRPAQEPDSERWRAKKPAVEDLIGRFFDLRKGGRALATDQLLNAVALVLSDVDLSRLEDTVFAPLDGEPD